MAKVAKLREEKNIFGWGQFWLRSITAFILYAVVGHIIFPLPLTVNTRDPLKIFVFYLLAYLSTYLMIWVIVSVPVIIFNKVNPRLRTIPVSHILTKVVPYILVFLALITYGRWYGGR